jgi:hypothetical protein
VADPQTDDYFDRFDPDKGASFPEPEAPPANPFDVYGPDPAPRQTGAGAAFLHGAERSALPAVGGLAGAGAGAEGGAAIGAAIGAPFGGVGAGPGAAIGGIIGGIGGFIAGSSATESAQRYALSKAPDSFKEAIGQDDRTEQLEGAQHPYASFMGGLVPYALTMNPTAAARKLPANATALQRILANPVTARVFGGAAMGGMELGQEKVEGEPADWAKVAIATGFGVVFNRPNRIGEAISNLPLRAFRGVEPVAAPRVEPPEEPAIEQPDLSGFEGLYGAITERPAEESDIPGALAPGIATPQEPGAFTAEGDASNARQPLEPRESVIPQPETLDLDRLHDETVPTVSQAGDLGIMGVGFTEDTYFGYALPDEHAQMTAWDAERTERSVVGPAEPPPNDTAARRMEPELFAHYDDLNGQRDALRAHLDSLSNPSDEDVAQVRARQGELQQQLEAKVAAAGGYAGGPDARRLRAQIRDAQNEEADLLARRQAFEAGKGKDTPEMTAARQHLQTIDFQLRDVAREVAAARRRAAEAVGNETIAPAPLPPERPVAQLPLEPAAPELPLATEKPKAKAAIPKEPNAAVAPEAPAPVEELAATVAPPPPVQPRTIEEQRALIERDFFKRLVAAGRPVDEAEATSKLVSALYETHAGRVGVTPWDLYQREPIGVRVSDRLKNAFGSLTPKGIINLARDANASTFIHELAHSWLNRILRDAEHPAATAALKSDAAVIRKWLGADSGAPARAQHERFARAFERYVQEGVAPSARLASVFAKFKNWLVEAYRSIKGLSAPGAISEDIRSVFDRMLSAEPQRVVVAPEAARGPTLADIHESDAALTEPADAGAAADRIAAERAQAEQEPPEDIANEVAPIVAHFETAAAGEGTEPVGEAGGGPAGRAEVEPGRGDGGPQPPSGGVGGGPSAQREGGVATAPEGGGVSGRPERRAAGADAGPAIAPKPSVVIDARESPFLDRAGNIRVENLTTDKDVAQAIHDAADANDDFIGDRRGVITDGQVEALASALGMDASKLSRRKLGEAFNAESVVAARRLLIQSATQVAAAMKKAAIGSDEDVLAYAVAKDRHQMIQGQVAGITAEAGRALRAFRSIAGQETEGAVDQFLRTATGRSLFQLKEEAKLGAQLTTPEQVSKLTADAIRKPSFGRMILEYWVNGLISGPATHTTYMIGNTILSIEKHGVEAVAAAAIGAARRTFGREGNVVRLGEVGAAIRGVRLGLAPAAKASLDALRSGQTTLLPGEVAAKTSFQQDLPAAPPPTLDEAATMRDVRAAAFGIVRGIRDGFVSGAELVKAGGNQSGERWGWQASPLGTIPDLRVGATTLPLGTAARLPSRFIAAIHSLFRSMNYSIEKNRLAYRAASDEGLSGQALAARVGDLRQNPTPEMMEQSVQGATVSTLMGPGGDFVRKLSAITNWSPTLPLLGETPILKFIDPFVHIAANIIDQSLVQRTPFGLLSNEIRADLMGKNGNVAQDTAQARMLVGTGLAVAFGSLAAEGSISGSGPSDPHKAAMWRLAGNQPHSVKIGETWYQANKLGPMGMLMGVAADMYDVAHQAASGDMLTAGSALMHGVIQNVLDESFMRGPADLIEAIEDPQRHGQQYIQNFLSSFTPFSVGMAQMARASDPYSRSARTVMDSIKAKIPGLSESLFPRRDVWGQPIPSYDALVARGLTAVYMTQMSRDPVNIAMADLGMGPAPVERTIRNVKLDDEQYDDFARIAGRLAKGRLDVIVRSPDFQYWTPAIKRDVITEAIAQSREAARGMMMMKYPSIPAAATQAKRDKFNG